MTRHFRTLAGIAAVCTYLLIVLGAVVRITGSGLGCGEHWPLCNGRLFPPLDDVGTVIEWSHRLAAALVSILVVAVVVVAAWFAPGLPPGVRKTSTAAFGLLVLQVLLGAITVKLSLPAWTVVLHLGTAMLLLATLIGVASGGVPRLRAGSVTMLTLTFATVLFGALTANLGAAAACGGFPLCNGQVWTTAGPLAVIHWTHRLLAYSLAASVTVWVIRSRRTAPAVVLGLIVLQVIVAAAMVLNGLPRILQAAHLAIGTAVWAAIVLAVLSSPQNRAAPETPSPRPPQHEREKPVSSAS
jgi:heme a synthase